MGRALLVSPFFASSVMAAQLLLALDDEDARKRLLPGIADGSSIVTVALGRAQRFLARRGRPGRSCR